MLETERHALTHRQIPTVAVLDSADQIAGFQGFSLVKAPPDPSGHGVAVGLSVLAEGPIALLPVRVLDDRAALAGEGVLLEALERLAEVPGLVICCAFATGHSARTDFAWRDSAVRSRVAALREAGTPVVAAAGNHYALRYRAGMGWPAILREVVSVGALKEGQMHPSSNRLLNGPDGCATTLFAEEAPPGCTSGAAARVAARLALARAASPEAGISAWIEAIRGSLSSRR